MKIIDLSQNTNEWLDFRRDKIGASDAPVIMQKSPYKTLSKLLQEKLHGNDSTYEHQGMKEGKLLEPYALELFNAKFNCNAKPAVIQDDTHPFLIASLDGIDFEKQLMCEIKCPNKQDHFMAIRGYVPEKYIPQLQHQLMLTGYNKMTYCSFRDLELITIDVESDLEYQRKLLRAEKEFFKSMQIKLLSSFFFEFEHENPFLDEFFFQLEEIRKQKKELMHDLENKEKQLINTILLLTKHNDYKSRYCTIKEIKRTVVDYKKMVEDLNLDTSFYTKESKYWDIRKTNF